MSHRPTTGLLARLLEPLRRTVDGVREAEQQALKAHAAKAAQHDWEAVSSTSIRRRERGMLCVVASDDDFREARVNVTGGWGAVLEIADDALSLLKEDVLIGDPDLDSLNLTGRREDLQLILAGALRDSLVQTHQGGRTIGIRDGSVVLYERATHSGLAADVAIGEEALVIAHALRTTWEQVYSQPLQALGLYERGGVHHGTCAGLEASAQVTPRGLVLRVQRSSPLGPGVRLRRRLATDTGPGGLGMLLDTALVLEGEAPELVSALQSSTCAEAALVALHPDRRSHMAKGELVVFAFPVPLGEELSQLVRDAVTLAGAGS